MPFSLFTTSIAVAGRPPKFKSFSAITLNRRDPSCAQMVCHQIMYMVDCFFSVFFSPPILIGIRCGENHDDRVENKKRASLKYCYRPLVSGLWTLDFGQCQCSTPKTLLCRQRATATKIVQAYTLF